MDRDEKIISMMDPKIIEDFEESVFKLRKHQESHEEKVKSLARNQNYVLDEYVVESQHSPYSKASFKMFMDKHEELHKSYHTLLDLAEKFLEAKKSYKKQYKKIEENLKRSEKQP